MRNVMYLLGAALLAVCLSACGQKGPEAGGEVPVDALYDPEAGTVITLGMTRTQAEELLGEGTYQKPITYLPGQMAFTPTEGMTGFGQTDGGEVTFVVTDTGTATYVYGQGDGRLVLTYRVVFLGNPQAPGTAVGWTVDQDREGLAARVRDPEALADYILEQIGEELFPDV